MTAPPAPDPRRAIVAVIEDVLDIEVHDFDPDRLLRDLVGWDSISHLHVVLALEQRFDIAIPDDQAVKLATLGDIHDLIRSRTG